jgi:uncharacterized membrane protein YoaK (UPF0700 family)
MRGGAHWYILSVPVFMLVLFLTRLLAISLDRAGLPTLQPLVPLQLLLLVTFLALCVVAGPWSNSDATAAIVAGMFGVAAMAVQNAARTDLVPEHPIDGRDDKISR